MSKCPQWVKIGYQSTRTNEEYVSFLDLSVVLFCGLHGWILVNYATFYWQKSRCFAPGRPFESWPPQPPKHGPKGRCYICQHLPRRSNARLRRAHKRSGHLPRSRAQRSPPGRADRWLRPPVLWPHSSALLCRPCIGPYREKHPNLGGLNNVFCGWPSILMANKTFQKKNKSPSSL